MYLPRCRIERFYIKLDLHAIQQVFLFTKKKKPFELSFPFTGIPIHQSQLQSRLATQHSANTWSAHKLRQGVRVPHASTTSVSHAAASVRLPKAQETFGGESFVHLQTGNVRLILFYMASYFWKIINLIWNSNNWVRPCATESTSSIYIKKMDALDTSRLMMAFTIYLNVYLPTLFPWWDFQS